MSATGIVLWALTSILIALLIGVVRARLSPSAPKHTYRAPQPIGLSGPYTRARRDPERFVGLALVAVAWALILMALAGWL